jgi:hypothetical protein
MFKKTLIKTKSLGGKKSSLNYYTTLNHNKEIDTLIKKIPTKPLKLYQKKYASFPTARAVQKEWVRYIYLVKYTLEKRSDDPFRIVDVPLSFKLFSGPIHAYWHTFNQCHGVSMLPCGGIFSIEVLPQGGVYFTNDLKEESNSYEEFCKSVRPENNERSRCFDLLLFKHFAALQREKLKRNICPDVCQKEEKIEFSQAYRSLYGMPPSKELWTELDLCTYCSGVSIVEESEAAKKANEHSFLQGPTFWKREYTK